VDNYGQAGELMGGHSKYGEAVEEWNIPRAFNTESSYREFIAREFTAHNIAFLYVVSARDSSPKALKYVK
jgi:hypothetical protein